MHKSPDLSIGSLYAKILSSRVTKYCDQSAAQKVPSAPAVKKVLS